MAIDWGTLRRHAEAQSDLLTRRQCLDAGMTPQALRWRVTSGRWLRVHDGVFQTRPGRTGWSENATAGLLFALSGGRVADAALRGPSAAYLWGLVAHAPHRVHLVVPQRRSVVAQPGMQVRRSMRWDDLVDDRVWPWRTTVRATVLDIATGGTALDALSIVARAVQRELVTPRELLSEIVARGGHRHSRVLREGLRGVEDGAESGAELLYLRDVERAHGLPRSVGQSPSDVGARRRHDHEYTPYRLIVEVDGRLGHEQWSDRVRDGRRDRQLLTADRLTTRVFFADVALEPCRTAAEISAILVGRGWRGRPRGCRRAGCLLRHATL
ncbi:type IV toxin-antitoxin system AbiEi family antitoxin domain-containing protein [Pedococcus sp. KACC 23699]|uniref:Type IV toxin-antitoxin system AbiEi family antitoxin domain-containing protein n=1 Tax=Pedococcus sp. KACC 23699 TaxID=3149228 RepID=A0AAU7JVV9_9MICO